MISRLEDFNVYALAMNVGEDVWKIVSLWDNFERDVIGRQLIRSCDSIAANLAESLGRYHFKETKNFSYYSRGSLFETKSWLTKAYNRNLISKDEFDSFMVRVEQMGRMINAYIASVGNVKEPLETYGASTDNQNSELYISDPESLMP